jgi:hypothetical protein
MIKISSENIKETMLEAASVIRDQESKLAELQEKIAHFQKKERCEKIASVMEEKNINSGMSFSEKVAELMHQEDLNRIESAVEIVTPHVNTFELERTEKTASSVDAKLKLYQALNAL